MRAVFLQILLFLALQLANAQQNADIPPGAVLRRYTLVISSFLNPNVVTFQPGFEVPPGFPMPGTARAIIGFNNSLPGPVIEANEGEWLSVRVINALTDVGTTVHWHGIYQLGTPLNDGVPGASQCAIQPGSSMLYNFQALPAGTFWYHGHYDNQYTDGLIGALIIHPAAGEPYANTYTKEYLVVIQDWYNLPALAMLPFYLSPASQGNEPTPDAIMVNGCFSVPPDATASSPNTTATPFVYFPSSFDDVVRFRVINAAAFSMWQISVDGMPLQIIEVDATATEPYVVNNFVVNVAQRVSFLVDFRPLRNLSSSLQPNALFLRVNAMLDMYPTDPTTQVPPYEPNLYPYQPPSFLNPQFLAIVDFSNKRAPFPSYSPSALVPFNVTTPSIHVDTPVDTNILAARPLTVEAPPAATHTLYMEIEFYADAQGVNRAHFNDISFDVMTLENTTQPVLYNYIQTPPLLPLASPWPLPTVPPTPPTNRTLGRINGNAQGLYELPFDSVIEVLINNTDGGEHPIHLHSHFFWIIATSDYPEAEQLFGSTNPMRRDTVSVPAQGWAKIRFQANIPGVWPFHCHIDWHMAAGLFALFVEAPDQLLANPPFLPPDHTAQCAGPALPGTAVGESAAPPSSSTGVNVAVGVPNGSTTGVSATSTGVAVGVPNGVAASSSGTARENANGNANGHAKGSTGRAGGHHREPPSAGVCHDRGNAGGGERERGGVDVCTLAAGVVLSFVSGSALTYFSSASRFAESP